MAEQKDSAQMAGTPPAVAIAEPAASKAAANPMRSAEVSMDDTRPQTRGDTFYDITQFLMGKVFILLATAALAFTAHKEYGPEKIGPFPNVLKRLQTYLEDKMAFMHKWGMKDGREISPKKRDMGILLSVGTASTVVLSWGGNAFAPVIKWLENNREGITNWYNKRFGTPQEVEITKEKFSDMPKQNWHDVIKGRAMAFATVFTAITGAYLTFGRSKSPNHHFKLDWYEDAFARKFSWLSKGSHDIAATPMNKALDAVQRKNKVYRFGKVLAIDLFATSTAIVVWNTVSRLSAKNRANGHHPDPSHPVTQNSVDTAPQPDAERQPDRYTDKLESKTVQTQYLGKKVQAQPYADRVSKQRAAAEQENSAALSN
ncbi:MAG: hypothetical protein AB7L92_05235 [Alphaproteobacteria bacterium]